MFSRSVLSFYDSKAINFSKELCICGLRDAFYKNLHLNALKEFVVTEDIMHCQIY